MSSKATTPLQREHVLSPITALAFFESQNGSLYVLSGEDTHLKIHETDTQRLCAELRVFAAQPIHGLFAGEGTDVLVWGGPSAALVPRAHVERLLRGEAVDAPGEARAPDCIYDGALLSLRGGGGGGLGLGAMVTAHNEVVPVRAGPGPGRGALELGRLRHPPSRPILYSAKVSWASGDVVLVAAGTVFGEIIVWRASSMADGDGDDGVCEVLFVFSGHEGSIFGVDISPELALPTGERVRLLASCSDDRTIRLWDITDRPKALADGHSASLHSGARGTGFGESDDETAEPRHSSRPVAVVMGHISRIWQVRFSPLGLDSSNSLKVYSFGEDCTTQRWRLDLDGRGILSAGRDDRGEQFELGSKSLTHEDTVHAHVGKHIWSTAIWPRNFSSRQLLIATGGSDGKINLIGRVADPGLSDQDSPQENADSRKMEISGSDISVDSFHSLHDVQFEPLHMYTFLSETTILATTASGRLFKGCLKGSVSWLETPVPIEIRNDLQRYQVVKSLGAGVVLLGSASGRLHLYEESGRTRTITKTPGKIAEIICLSQSSFRGHKLLGTESLAKSATPVMVTLMGNSQATLLLLDPTSEDVVLRTYAFELDKGFTVTAAGVCQAHFIFGSRVGTILVFKERSPGTFQCVARINASSKDAVSSILELPGKSGVPSPYFLTTSRDGKYRIYEIDTTSSQDTQAHLRHEASPPLGPMVEGAVFVDGPDGRKELVISGFRSKNFIVWNETRQQEIANVECGGAHRAFTYDIHRKHAEQVSFIWTKASKTCIYTQHQVSYRPLKQGGHGREIKAVASRGNYVATGAEDTAIRIWKYDSGGNDGSESGLDCLAVLEKHVGGIQGLKWVGENYLLSSAGLEELFVWRITRLDSDYEGLAVVCEALYPDRTRDGDLRINSFDVETAPEDKDVLFISLLLSNSTLKSYRYSKTDGFRFLSLGRYTGACMTQLRHLRVTETDVHILTASTDGHLAVWKTEKSSAGDDGGFSEYTLVGIAKLHQSTVKALDLREITTTEATSYAVVTGGDDDAIGYVKLAWDRAANKFGISSRSLANGAHAAAITGICIIGIETGAMTLCTASNDQRIKYWRMAIGDSGLTKMSLLANRYSSIADCGGLESMSSGEQVMIAGVGMEVWQL